MRLGMDIEKTKEGLLLITKQDIYALVFGTKRYF